MNFPCYGLLLSINLSCLYGKEGLCSTLTEEKMLIAVRELLTGDFYFSYSCTVVRPLKRFNCIVGLVAPTCWTLAFH